MRYASYSFSSPKATTPPLAPKDLLRVPIRMIHHQQIEQINQVLIEIAGGNFHYFAPISDNFDEIDAIAS